MHQICKNQQFLGFKSGKVVVNTGARCNRNSISTCILWKQTQSFTSWPFENKQNKWQSEKIHLIIPDIQVNKQDKTGIFCSKIFDFIAKSSSVQE